MSALDSSPRSSAVAEDGELDPLAFPPFTHSRRSRAELVRCLLRGRRPVPDEIFDDIYPDAVRRASSAHWTPVRVCARVVELLRLQPGERLLDIGSGAGKFCIVAAAMTRARVCGVEREPRLASVAREAARRFGVDVDFADGPFDAEDPRRIDAAYLFNPFTETILLPADRDFAADRFAGRTEADVVAAEAFLARARVGTRVAPFFGFGGQVPADYELLAQETCDGGMLEVWERRLARR